MEILAGAAFILLAITCALAIVIAIKLTSSSTTINKLNSDSETIKTFFQNIQSQLNVVLDILDELGGGNNMEIENSMIGPPGQQHRVFKSLDGKYTADTFEKLMEMMRKDVDYKEIKDIMNDDEDDDDEKKPWENGKE